MNRRAVLDVVRPHLLKQMEKSYKPDSRYCAYRGSGGRMCAFGPLIRDDLYKWEMDGGGRTMSMGVGKLLDSYPEVRADIEERFGKMGVGDYIFLMDIQSVHDGHDPSDWAVKLADLEKRCDV